MRLKLNTTQNTTQKAEINTLKAANNTLNMKVEELAQKVDEYSKIMEAMGETFTKIKKENEALKLDLEITKKLVEKFRDGALECSAYLSKLAM